MSETERRYKIGHVVIYDPDGATKEEIEAQGFTGSDAVIVVSVIRNEDGSTTTSVSSLDGETNEDVSDSELWKAWVMVAKKLADSKTLEKSRRDLAMILHELVMSAITKGKI